MANMIYCEGTGCVLALRCARHTRTPDGLKQYEVFKEPPHKEVDCDYFWPEAVPGVIDKDTSQIEVLKMGKKPVPDFFEDEGGQQSFVQPDQKVMPSIQVENATDFAEGQGAFFAAGGTIPDSLSAKAAAVEPAFKLKPLLWPDADEQDQIFQTLLQCHHDIIQLRIHCAKIRDTKPEEVWLVLDALKTRLDYIIYGDARPDDDG